MIKCSKYGEGCGQTQICTGEIYYQNEASADLRDGATPEGYWAKAYSVKKEGFCCDATETLTQNRKQTETLEDIALEIKLLRLARQ